MKVILLYFVLCIISGKFCFSKLIFRVENCKRIDVLLSFIAAFIFGGTSYMLFNMIIKI